MKSDDSDRRGVFVAPPGNAALVTWKRGRDQTVKGGGMRLWL